MIRMEIVWHYELRAFSFDISELIAGYLSSFPCEWKPEKREKIFVLRIFDFSTAGSADNPFQPQKQNKNKQTKSLNTLPSIHFPVMICFSTKESKTIQNNIYFPINNGSFIRINKISCKYCSWTKYVRTKINIYIQWVETYDWAWCISDPIKMCVFV